MQVTISPRPIRGRIESISSKSMAHRLLILAALSKKPQKLFVNATNEDMDATARCLSAIGAAVTYEKDGFVIAPFQDAATSVDCGESGSTLRFLLPVLGACGKDVTLTLRGRLPERPLSPLWEELTRGGMVLSWENPNTLSVRGQLQSGAFSLPGNISSQFISGLLFALPVLEGDSTLRLTTAIESENYIKMTEDALRRFGIQFTFKDNVYSIPGGQTPRLSERELLRAEGDWSNAAFWLVAGALSQGVTVDGLARTSLQGDREIVPLLSRFGAAVSEEETSVFVKNERLSGLSLSAAQIPDLVPILSVLAAGASGKTTIYGAERLKIKESDRLEAVYRMLTAVGGRVQKTEDGLIIDGGTPLSGGTVDSFSDHRIAMSAAILSSICHGPVTILGAESVNKSYPAFWEHFALLGGQFERSETP